MWLSARPLCAPWGLRLSFPTCQPEVVLSPTMRKRGNKSCEKLKGAALLGWCAEAQTTHVTRLPKGQARRGPRWAGFSSPADKGTNPSQGRFSVMVHWPLRCFLGS